MTQIAPLSGATDEYEAVPERRLMLAVLLHAIQDAAGGNHGTISAARRSVVRGTALGWIKEAGPDFQMVCHLAGLDPAHVRGAALEFIASEKPVPRVNRASIDSTKRGRGRPRKVPAHA